MTLDELIAYLQGIRAAKGDLEVMLGVGDTVHPLSIDRILVLPRDAVVIETAGLPGKSA